MAINVTAERQEHADTPPGRSGGGRQETQGVDGLNQGRKRFWLIGTGGIIVVGILAAMIIKSFSSGGETDLGLTHTVKRGNLTISVIEQGTLESSENTEIKCKVRGDNVITWVVESGTEVKPGDLLVKLDTLAIEEAIAERTKFAHSARSAAERSKADVARAKLAILEYEQGLYQSNLASLERDLAISKANQRSAENWFRHTKMLSDRGFATDSEVDERSLQVKQSDLDVSVKETQIEVLKEFTRREQLAILNGDLKALAATHEANVERAKADASRRDRAVEELDFCEVRSEKSGMVIYPKAEEWKQTPDIEEGALVHLNQVLLLMPNLSRMQVKVGIHESVIDRVKPGFRALVSLPDRTLDAKVTEVAMITRPAGWWTGNVVKYDTIIELPTVQGLKPGMTAGVEVVLAEHEDVLTIPVNAVVQTAQGNSCWVKSGSGAKRRPLELGDSNDEFIVVVAGLEEGDEVVLDPLAYIKEAQQEAMKPQMETVETELVDDESATIGNPDSIKPD